MSGPSADLAITGSLGAFRIALRTVDGHIHASLGDPGTRPDLAVLVAGACADAGLAPESIAALIVDVGPGSYTGLRVATTFANTCRAFAGMRVQSLTSLELVAAALEAPPPTVRVVLDARRGRWHHARLDIDARIALSAPPAAEPIAAVLATLDQEADAAARPLHVVADPALHPAIAEALGSRVHLRPLPAVDGTTIFDPRLRPRPSDTNLEPLYLMGSYAETPEA